MKFVAIFALLTSLSLSGHACVNTVTDQLFEHLQKNTTVAPEAFNIESVPMV